jgi:farnesol dehydrogenase
MKKVFVTGATGFIGEKLCLNLLERGYEVHAIVRGVHRAQGLADQGVKLYNGDLSSMEVLRDAMKGCQLVIHGAAYAAAWNPDPQAFFKANVEGTVNVLEAAKLTGIERVLFVSTAGTIGPSLGKPITEDTIRLVDFFNEYESSKAMAEEWALRYVVNGLDVVIAMPTRVFGPGPLEKNNGFVILTHKYVVKKWVFVPGNGKGRGNYVFVDDLVEGLVLALEKGRTGEKYLLGSENVSYSEFFDSVKEFTGKNYPIVKLPLWVIFLVARVQGQMAKTFKRPPFVTMKWARRYLVDWEMDCSKARRELGFNPRPVKAGIQETVDWVKATFLPQK